MLDKKTPVIKCPVCGQQYMPSEIYIPANFFGNQGEIIKNSEGEIDLYIGDDMDLKETYVCDGCNSKLSIEASLDFKVTVDQPDLSEEYVSSFVKPKKLKLAEPDIFND